jgi:hypothetical protein
MGSMSSWEHLQAFHGIVLVCLRAQKKIMCNVGALAQVT